MTLMVTAVLILVSVGIVLAIHLSNDRSIAAQAEEIHACIRSVIEAQFGPQVADDMTILYGGSCKPSNAKELFAQKDIDGGLIGGAALKAEDFIQIALSF